MTDLNKLYYATTDIGDVIINATNVDEAVSYIEDQYANCGKITLVEREYVDWIETEIEVDTDYDN